MNEIFNLVISIITYPIVSELMVCVTTAIVTYFFTIKKTRKQVEEQYKSRLGEKIVDSYVKVREIICEADKIEIYGVDEIDPVEDIMASQSQAVYPSFMVDQDSLTNFFKKITQARADYEQYLDLKSAAYLLAMERYLMSLALYVKEKKVNSAFQELGCIVVIDVTKWRKTFDKHIVKMLNRPRFKLHSKIGKCWEKEKTKATILFLESSILNQLIKGMSYFPLDITTIATRRDAK